MSARKGRAVRWLGVLLAVAVPIGLATPVQAAPSTPTPLVGNFCSAGASIVGRGATFANNAYVDVFIPTYNQQCGKGIVTYESRGSGAGKESAIKHLTNFAQSDEPLSPDEQARGTADADGLQGRVSPLHHIPVALGAITVSYNTTCTGTQLKLRSPVVAAIYTGLITRWNDPLIVAENPGLASCNRQIKPVARSDGSGTTYAFKDYLSKRNPQFQVYKQNDFNTRWPVQDLALNTLLRGNGNSGVAAVVKGTADSMGYVELSTAQNNGLKWAQVDGASGVFNNPNTAGGAANCDLAGIGATHPPSTLSPGWEAVSITDTPSPLAYAICTFTYALVYNNLQTAGVASNRSQAQTIADLFALAVDNASQNKLPAAGYAKLPPNIQAIAQAGVASLAWA